MKLGGIFCKEDSVCLKGWKEIELVLRNKRSRYLPCREWGGSNLDKPEDMRRGHIPQGLHSLYLCNCVSKSVYSLSYVRERAPRG